MSRISTLTDGIVKKNPVLVLVLGTCPALAVSTQAANAFGMGIAVTAVLLGSNVFISLLRNIIPDKVRIPCYIVLIAGFVTLTEMIVEAYAYRLYRELGIFLPLIVVNCIILGRAEMYANKNGVLDSALDAIGMGAGFTLALLVMSSIREVFGSGTWFGMELPWLGDYKIAILTMAPGGFFIFGVLIALVNKILKGQSGKKQELGCGGCASASACGGAEREGGDDVV